MENEKIISKEAPKKKGRPLKGKKSAIVNEKSPILQMEENNKTEDKITLGQIKTNYIDMYQKIYKFSNPEYQKNVLTTFNDNNPFMQNTRLKRMSSSPIEHSKEDIVNGLKNPQFSEQILREASWSLSSSQYLYYKIIRNASDIPLFNYYKIPENLLKEEYNKKDFKDEDNFTDEWLKIFDIKNTFKRISLEVKREGKSTYVLRNSINEEEEKRKVVFAYLQKLPTNYVKLTGIGQHGYIASFNMIVFLQPGFSPTQYPPIIQEIWKEMNDKGIVAKNDKGINKFIINKAIEYTHDYKDIKLNSIIESSKKEFMFWVQLPQEICYTFCSDTSNAWAVPDTASLFLDLQELTDYSVLAGLIASTPLTAVLTGEAEMVDNAQPGQDQSKLNAGTILGLQNLFNSMTSANIEAFFGPLKNLKLQTLQNIPNSTNIKTEALKNFLDIAGEGGLLIATEKPSIAQVKGSQLLEASQYDFVTCQFESVLNYIMNDFLDLIYYWEIKIWGDIYTIDTEKKFLKEAVIAGSKFFLPKLLSAEKLTVLNSKAICSYVDSLKLYDNLTGLVPTKSTVEAGNSAGRPALDENQIDNENTAKSRDAGNNVSDNKNFSQNKKCIMCHEKEVEEGQILCEECAEIFIDTIN